VLFLLTTPEIRAFLHTYTGLERPDGVEAGLGLVAERPDEVEGLLARASTHAERLRFHEASRLLPREARVDVIADTLVEAGVRRAARAGTAG
jgi:hypothetical protein